MGRGGRTACGAQGFGARASDGHGLATTRHRGLMHAWLVGWHSAACLCDCPAILGNISGISGIMSGMALVHHARLVPGRAACAA